jgi:hypothetical protein
MPVHMDPPYTKPVQGFVPDKALTCRTAIRPLPRAYQDCEYNEWLNPAIPYAVATNHKYGVADAAMRTGIIHENTMPYTTIQNLIVPAKLG